MNKRDALLSPDGANAPLTIVCAISRAFSASGQSRGLRLVRTGVAVKTSKARA